MKKIVLIPLALALSFLFFPAQMLWAGGNDAVLGKWYTTDKGAIVEIYECGDKLCGKIVWLADPNKEDGTPKTDINNPDDKKHNNPIIGLNMLKGFEKDGEYKWDEGSIYDPNNGKTYDCKMTLDGNTLEVRGYIGFSMFGRTETWTRAK